MLAVVYPSSSFEVTGELAGILMQRSISMKAKKQDDFYDGCSRYIDSKRNLLDNL